MPRKRYHDRPLENDGTGDAGRNVGKFVAKYNIPKRTTIDKKCEDDPEMMYPNPNFLTYFPDAELPEDQGRDARSSCLRIGTWIVIEKLNL